MTDEYEECWHYSNTRTEVEDAYQIGFKLNLLNLIVNIRAWDCLLHVNCLPLQNKKNSLWTTQSG